MSKDKNFVEATRESLVGMFVGHTAVKTKSVIDSALGGVLFIDEAYSLYDERQSYGAECISTLIKEMEDQRDNLCVIMAGYKNEMEKLIDMNTGFKSRIQFFVDFPDYTETELSTIFEKMVEGEKFTLDIGCKEIIIDYFKNEIKNKGESFSNGRLARNLFEKVKFEQASRVKREKCTNLDLITREDIINVTEKIKSRNIKKVIGFSA